MPRVTLDTPAKFRASRALIAAAQARADREGLTLSSLVRRALEREVATS